MAGDEIVMTVKSNLKQVTTETKEFTGGLEGATKAADDLKKSVSVQNDVLIEMEKELVKLEEAQAKMGKGTWKDSLSGTTRKIEAQKLAIKGEKVALKDLKNQSKQATEETKKFAKAQKDSAKEMKDGLGSLTLMGVSLNGIKKSFGKIIPISKMLFSSIKMGIAATGIGVLLLAFGALVTYFTSSKEAMDKLDVTIAKVSGGINVIKDRIARVGEILTEVFSTNFFETLNKIKNAFSGIGDEIEKEVELSGELEIATQTLRDAQMKLLVTRAEQNKLVAEARLLAQDETKSLDERKEALEEAVRLEKEMIQTEVDAQTERVRIMQEKFDMGLSNAEEEQTLFEEKAKLIDMETTSLKKQRSLARELNQMDKKIANEELERLQLIADEKKRIAEEEAEAQAKIDADKIEADAKKKDEDALLIELQQENMLMQIEDLRERALVELGIERDKQLASVEGFANEEEMKAEIEKSFALKSKALDEQKATWESISTKEKLGMASNAMGQMSAIMGKETKAGKAFAIGEATVSTYLSATKAYSSMSGIPVVGPALGAIAAGAAIAAGLKSIQAIKSSKAGGGGGGGGGSVPSIPSVSSNLPAPEMMSGEFEIEGGGGNINRPIKAFVVNDDMTRSQSAIANIRNRATI